MKQVSDQEQHQHESGSSFDEMVATIKPITGPTFRTDADLWPIYISSFSTPEERQFHNCRSCQRFLETFGGLVTIDGDTGETTSAIWSDMITLGNEYCGVVMAMKAASEKANVTSAFVSGEENIGVPRTGDWTHFTAKNNFKASFKFSTADQVEAQIKEDAINITSAFFSFDIETARKAVDLLKSDSLYLSNKVLGHAEWFLDLQNGISETKNRKHQKNILWAAAWIAPPGFAHIRSSMLGTLLTDIQSGFSVDLITSRFEEKMQPDKYLRPDSAPTAGAIDSAEKLIAELGIEKSLERRFAEIKHIKKVWEFDENVKVESVGVFGHLKEPAKIGPMVTSAGNITWVKFEREVLPLVHRIEIKIPAHKAGYTVFTAAENPYSPEIFQWTNRVAWYRWHGGVFPSHFNLIPGFFDVKAVCLGPQMWGGVQHENVTKSFSFIISGAHETKNAGNAIFPETLKSSLHPIRKVIEAFSRSKRLIDHGAPHVIGLGVGSTVRVHTSVVTEYTIDRWD